MTTRTILTLGLLSAASLIASVQGAASAQQGPDGLVPGANPILRDVFTADPAPLVHDGRVYLYVGHDEAEPGTTYDMNEWLVYTSDDLLNWTSHGAFMTPTDFDWAVDDAWASEVEEKDGKFWFYVTVEHDEGKGKAIGVAVADDPLGPFEDARGSALVTNDMTPQKGHAWSDIDPTIFTEEDGTSWLAWGNEQYFFAKLAPSMTALDGPIRTADLPYFVEGPWIHDHEGTYFLTYAGIDPQYGEDEQIHYATSDSVEGPWAYQGLLTPSTGTSFTIHPGIVEFEDAWYFFYHGGSLDIGGQEGGEGRRSVRVERLSHTEDGKLVPVEQTEAELSARPAR